MSSTRLARVAPRNAAAGALGKPCRTDNRRQFPPSMTAKRVEEAAGGTHEPEQLDHDYINRVYNLGGSKKKKEDKFGPRIGPNFSKYKWPFFAREDFDVTQTV